ncbi:MAG: DUF488 domain-containing protein [Nitrosomonas sp.]|nr:DUF488 domain-containing protein [Nitrosomonas sp.]MBK7364149.1 DUF488 domain-containing protein [Nitrosomonas sp.]
MIISTIGYEGIDIEEFIKLLRDYNIETIVDVREIPLSRKSGFSKKSLSNILNLSGFEYVHMAQLGCPKTIREHYRQDGNWKFYSEGFLKYLSTQKLAITELSDLAALSNCALLCYEADFNFCHRSMVANAVRDFYGAEIRHIVTSNAKTTSLASSQLAFV